MLMCSAAGDTLTLVSADGLEELARIAQEVERAERALATWRRARDEEIRRLVNADVSERRAAAAARVSPGYAHRCAVNGRFASTVR